MNKQFSTPTRKVSQRNKKIIFINSKELDEIKTNFDESIKDIKNKFKYVDLFDSPESNDDERNASYDLLRFQLVSIDSLLDYFMHQILVYGLKKIFNNEWKRTPKYNKILIKLEIVENIIINPENNDWFIDLCNEYKEKETAMSYDSLNNILDLIGIKINEITNTTGKDLNDIYSRRSIIVHHCDVDKKTKTKNTITKQYVSECVDKIENFVNDVYNAVKNKNARS